MEFLLTIDIGGTFIKLALISITGQLVEKEEVSTPQSIEEFSDVIDQYYKRMKKYSLIGISISSPGSVTDTGHVLGYSAVPFIHEHNVKHLLSKRYGLPVFMENDANCAALSELWKGAARECETFACIVCGTGVGGALVMNKKLVKGANLHGGEFGYSILASDTHENVYETWSEMGSSSALSRRLKHQPPYFEGWTGPRVFEQAGKHHVEARKSLDSFFSTLAIGIFNIQYIVDPEKILVGGGITRQPDFLEELEQRMDRLLEAKPIAKVRPSISLCHYLDEAQLVGTAYGWLKEYRKDDLRV
ncbi:ROK family protein [Rossellomorea sp. GCM10028870]|uniref:ROK family protein n=1 Tax=Rossellomorea sp. GCM10028870 TaxID=3273426 RepID=UPI00360C43E9